MSLINEALKRAQTEQVQRAMGIQDVQLPSLPVPRARPPGATSPFVAAVVASMIVAIGVAGLGVLRMRGGHPAQASGATSPDRVEAPSPPAEPQVPPHVKNEDPKPVLISNDNLRPAAPPAAAKPVPPGAAPLAASAAPGKKGSSNKPSESYVLSGIMHSASGDAALINGRLLRVGQHIGRAVVTRISDYTVEMDLDGRRITLGM